MNTWQADDEVTTTFGTIQQVKEENYQTGLKAGQRIEREAILEYIEHHPNATLLDITDEIEGRYKSDMNQQLKRMGL
jgi:hypothetical protein